MLATKQPKPKTCKNPACRASFVPQRLGQAVCNYTCGLAIKDVNQEKARKSLAQIERKEIKVRKEKLKSRADHMRETQVVFNEFIRLRDASHPCISCDSVSTDEGLITGSRWDAGHYRSVGSCPELRFPLNVHLQCNKNCNLSKSGNILGYRPRLLEKIGAEMLAWIEGPHEAKKYTIEQLKAMTAEYRAKTRELKRAAA